MGTPRNRTAELAKRPRWAMQVLARSELKSLQNLAIEELEDSGPLQAPCSSGAASSAMARRALVFWRKAMRRGVLPLRVEDLPEGLRIVKFDDFHASLLRWLADRQGPLESKVGGLMAEFFVQL